MRATLSLCVAACAAGIIFITSLPQPAQGYDLPSAEQLRWRPLGATRDYDVAFVPAIVPYTVDPNLSNIGDATGLSFLGDEHRKLLAENSFIILPSTNKEFYEIYLKNPAPFVTSDALLHAYHVLLSETVRQAEVTYLAERQAKLALAGLERMKALAAGATEALKPAADDALVYWAVAARLADPKVEAPKGAAGAVDDELKRIAEGKFIGAVGGKGPKRDYTVFQPIAGYGDSEALRSYFILNRYFTLWTQPLEGDRGAASCMLIALAVGTSDKALSAYRDIGRCRELLGGMGEDPTPITLLAAAGKQFGQNVTPADLTDADSLAKLRKAVAAQPLPTVADQPQSVPGADPLAGYGMRMFPPGVSVRAIAYQDVAAATAAISGTPRSEYVATLLGIDLPETRGQAKLLQRAKDELARRAKDASRQDVHTLSMLALSRLPQDGGKGYPAFVASGAWRLKTANTQLGSWSEIEHDLCLYLKDNTLYASAPMPLKGFHGYVEPAPRLYAALASLTARTREAFAELGAFAAPATQPNSGPGRRERPVVITEGHFRALEALLTQLRDMAVKELENRPFDEGDIKLLKDVGRSLKHLAMNDSTSDEALEPMSVVVRIAREYLEEKGRYVGVGRPLKIIAVVPYGGKLHWAVGGVYSYYEFDRPLRDALDDRQWKTITAPPIQAQPYQPWLMNKGLGLAGPECSAEVLRNWLGGRKGSSYAPGDKARFNSWSHGLCQDMLHRGRAMEPLALDLHAASRLSADAMDVAGEAWAKPVGEYALPVLYVLLREAPAEKRSAIAAAALAAMKNEFVGEAGDKRFISTDGLAWVYFTLRLMEGAKADADALVIVRDLRAKADGLMRHKGTASAMKEITDAADKVLPPAAKP